MHYVISDIHNDNQKFTELLRKIDLSNEDHLYILGDLFDRTMDHHDPVGVYFNILKSGDKCIVIRDNHDNYLAEYITKYYETPERKRKRLPPYLYDTFELLQQRLTPADIQELA